MKKFIITQILVVASLIFLSSSVFPQSPLEGSLASSDSDNTISLDLKGMDIVEVLKILSTKGGINIVVGSDVKGKVTMFLKDVSIEDALDLILVSNNLARDTRNGITYIMTEKDYIQLYGNRYDEKRSVEIIPLKFAKAADVSKALGQIKTNIGKVIVDEASNTIVVIDSQETVSKVKELINKIDKPTKTKIYEMNYARVKDLKEKLQEMLTKGVGTSQIDERTNKIVVTDLEDNFERIEKVILAFDDKLQQVLIEAKIVEVTLDDRYRFGVDWQEIIKELNKNFLKKDIGLRSAFRLATAGTWIPGGEILVGSFDGSNYGVLIQALKTVGDTNILSSPRITALNNQEAKILIGTNQPYATNTVTQGTSTTTTATSLTFIEIGVKLYVTPTINRDGFITIKIRPEVSSKSGDYTYGSPATTVPIISTTQAETSVTIRDGMTIIIAGLIRDERTSTINKIPLLGDIPLLGVPFRKTDNEIIKKELVIFLTPRIISGDVDYVEQPASYPIGEKKFTIPDSAAFGKRNPHKISPKYFKEPKGQDKEGKMDMSLSSSDTYYQTVKEMVLDNISIPKDRIDMLRKGDRVTLSFILRSGGNLVSEPKAMESTNEYLSGLAVEAVKKACPFPPFPQFIKEPEKDFTLDIVYGPS